MTTKKVATGTKPKKVTRSTKAAKSPIARKSNTTGPSTALSTQDAAKVLELVKGSNSIELKLSVPAADHHATIKAIGLDPVEAQVRQAYFFDTPDLALNRAGLIVRARRIQGGRGDTVVKLRPVDPATIDADLRRSESFKIEVDVIPGGFVCSASFKGVCTGKEVRNVSAGAAPLRSLFSKEQRAFYKAHAPAGIRIDSLVAMGPSFVLKAKHQPKGFDRGIVVEMWLYPNGSRILEVSTKCLPNEGFQIGAEFRSYLAKQGIAIAAQQETKTKAALDFFKAKLASDRLGGAPATKQRDLDRTIDNRDRAFQQIDRRSNSSAVTAT